MMDVLTDPKRGRDGLFPELVLFDCHACHHPMSDRRWTPGRQPGAGVVRLNDSNMLMVRQISRVVNAPLGTRVAATTAAAECPAATMRWRDALKADMKALIPIPEGNNCRGRHAESERSINEGLNGQHHDYAGAEQARWLSAAPRTSYERGISRRAQHRRGPMHCRKRLPTTTVQRRNSSCTANLPSVVGQ
jgi:hypothetical protein